jgi:hypothetical protein
MSTRNTEIDQDQEASHGAPGTISTEDALKLEKQSPTENVPQPPQPPSHKKRNLWFAIGAVVIVLALLFSVLAVFMLQPGKKTGTQVTPTAPATTIPSMQVGDTRSAPPAGVTWGPQKGPSSASSLAYWDAILGTKGTNGKVESVSFANVMGNPTLQALVTVRHSDANRTLDVYVFDQITSQHPVQIFHLGGLIKGEAKMSYYNTILTGEVNLNSTPDLYREFAWHNGSMTQVAFPGFYPVLTRYEAEIAQAQVNAGQETWRNNPVAVSEELLKWAGFLTNSWTTKVLKGGGPNDLYAVVQVQEAPIQNVQPTALVTLSRLEGNTHNMWVVIGVADSTTLTLKNITPGQVIHSPVTLQGTGSAFNGEIGWAFVTDHSYNSIGQDPIVGSKTNGEGTYTTTVTYGSSFHGIQEGIVSVYEGIPVLGYSEQQATWVMMKVLISG